MNTFYTTALTALLAASPDAGTPSASSPQPARLVNHINKEQCLEITLLGLDYERSAVPLSDSEAVLKTVLTRKGYVVNDDPTTREPNIPVLSVHYRPDSVVFYLRDSQKSLHWSTVEEFAFLSAQDFERVIPPSCPLLREGKEEKQEGHGYLRINSQPFSDIWIDGKNTNLQTPVMTHRVPAGKHTVTLRNDRYKCEGTYDVNVKADQTVVLMKKLECEDNK